MSGVAPHVRQDLPALPWWRRCPSCNMQHATRNVQHAAHNTQRATRSTQRATRNTQHATHNVQRATQRTTAATERDQRTVVTEQQETRRPRRTHRALWRWFYIPGANKPAQSTGDFSMTQQQQTKITNNNNNTSIRSAYSSQRPFGKNNCPVDNATIKGV